tara:strand:+ start:996 stop:1280 length:285 start_codon:yes stop_codon:yes gene_type:complete
MGIQVPRCSAYGAFDEAVVQLACTFGDQSGRYCSHVWHNGPAGIAAEREIYGTPRFLADIQLRSMAHPRPWICRSRGADVAKVRFVLPPPTPEI